MGVEQLSPSGWRFSQDFEGVQLNPKHSSQFLKRFNGDFTLDISGRFHNTSKGVLLLISRPDKILPHLEISIDVQKSVLVLRYLGVKSFQRVTLDNVFSVSRWVYLQVMLHNNELSVSVDCRQSGAAVLKQTIDLIPKNAEVWFSSKMKEDPGLQVCSL